MSDDTTTTKPPVQQGEKALCPACGKMVFKVYLPMTPLDEL